MIRALFLGLTVTLFFNMVVAIWLHRTRRAAGPGWWAAGAALIAAGTLLIGARGHVPDFASFVVSNVVIIAGYGVTWFGMRRYMGRPLRRAALPGVVLITIAVGGLSYYFSMVVPSTDVRVLASSIGIFILSLCISNTLLSGHHLPKSIVFTGGAYCLNALASSMRFIGPLLPSAMADFLYSGTMTILFMGFSIVFNLVVIGGQWWMVHDAPGVFEGGNSAVDLSV